ncbi:hypothetical protein FRB90_012007 [Tulasnella sp. 427]|nr:hypothetical protein FRB90_012007 [Tulasnella sp. 427]
MAPKATFREVYVDIPPSPYTSTNNQARQQQQQPRQAERAPKPRFRAIPVVEIPHSPLWKHTPQQQEEFQHQRPIASLKMNSSRPAPLKEKNTQRTNVPQDDDQKPAKRKAADLDESNDAKKPRLDMGVNQTATKRRGRPTKAEQAARAAAGPTQNGVPSAPAPKLIVRRPRKAAAPPMPGFKALPYAITRQEAEDRMMMREFFHRFSELLRFPKTHRDSLDDFSRPPELNVVKNMFSSLLDILTEDSTEKDVQEVFKEARVNIRKCSDVKELGVAVKSLRTSAPSVPLPSLSNANQEKMHSKKPDTLESTIQLVPSVLSLIEFALQGPSIRNDVEEGIEVSKTIRATAEEKIKLEKTIWANVKKTWTDKRDSGVKAEQQAREKPKEGQTLPASETFDLKQWKEEFRAIENKHQTKIRRLQLGLMQQLSTNNLRFTSAGTDLDGRTYWTLSLPAEGAKAPSAEDREEFRRWAWFLAVWVPSHSVSPATSRATSSTAVSDEADGIWYALGEAQEVRALIKWLDWKTAEKEKEEVAAQRSSSESNHTMSSELVAKKLSKQPWRADMKTLSKRLEDFADFLEWKSRHLIAARGVSRRNASSHAHDEHHDDHGHGSQDTYQYAPEGFFTPFWRNTIVLSILGYGLYAFAPSRTGADGKENSLTSWIRTNITPSEIWRSRNETHLILSMEQAEAKHLAGSAQRPLMMRTRYPGKFEDASPHKRPVGDTVDYSDLNVKSDSHMAHDKA